MTEKAASGPVTAEYPTVALRQTHQPSGADMADPQRIIAAELERNFGRLFAWQADRIIEALRDEGYAITREALCARSGGCGD